VTTPSRLMTYEEMTAQQQNPHYTPDPPGDRESTASLNWIPLTPEERLGMKPDDTPAQAPPPPQPMVQQQMPPSLMREPQGEPPLIEDTEQPKPSKFDSFIGHPVTQNILKAIAAGGFGMVGQGPQFLMHLANMQERNLDQQATVQGLQVFSKASQLASAGKLQQAQGMMEQFLASSPRAAKAMPDMIKRFEGLVTQINERQAAGRVAMGLKKYGSLEAAMQDEQFVSDYGLLSDSLRKGLTPRDQRDRFKTVGSNMYNVDQLDAEGRPTKVVDATDEGQATPAFLEALTLALQGDAKALKQPGLGQKEAMKLATILQGKKQGLHFNVVDEADGRYIVGMNPMTGQMVSKEYVGAREYAPSIDREIIQEADRRGLKGPQRIDFFSQTKAGMAGTREAAVQGERPMGEGQQKEVVAYNNILSAVDQLSQFSPEEMQKYSGLVNRPLAEAKNIVTGLLGKGADQRFLQFKTLMGRMQSEAFTVAGKQLTPFEYSVVSQFTPTGREAGGAAEIQAKLQSFKAFTTIKRDVTLELVKTGRAYVDPSEMDARIKARMMETGVPVPIRVKDPQTGKMGTFVPSRPGEQPPAGLEIVR